MFMISGLVLQFPQNIAVGCPPRVTCFNLEIVEEIYCEQNPKGQMLGDRINISATEHPSQAELKILEAKLLEASRSSINDDIG
jgi:hypothetical protein